MKQQIKYFTEQRKKDFLGTCVDNPFGSSRRLEEIIDDAREITKKTFLKHTNVDDTILADMKRYPYDYEYYKYKNIFFYTHSAIEHFYR